MGTAWEPIFGVYALMASFVAGGICFLVWAVRSGAMTGGEAPKYRMLEDDGAADGPASAPRRDGGTDGEGN